MKQAPIKPINWLKKGLVFTLLVDLVLSIFYHRIRELVCSVGNPVLYPDVVLFGAEPSPSPPVLRLVLV
jgi:hypothetical protein